MAIEGFSFFDAVYQTLTTITTAGFGEVEPLSDTGRAFTLVLIVVGIIVILYVLSCITQIAVEGEQESILGRRRMHSRMRALNDHYILCGFGRVGEEVAREFARIEGGAALWMAEDEVVVRMEGCLAPSLFEHSACLWAELDDAA